MHVGHMASLVSDTWQAMLTHRTHGKPCVNLLASANVYKMGGDQFVEEGRHRKERRRKKKRERKERKKERENEKKGREKEGENEVVILTVGTRRTKK